MIAVQLKGGLGNQLFQYATGRQLALKHKTDLVFDTSFLSNRVPDKAKTFYNYELGFFDLPVRLGTSKDFPQYSGRFSTRNRFTRGLHLLHLRARGLRYVRQRTARFDSEIPNLPDHVYLDGYWQSENYFVLISPQIRSELQSPLSLGPEAATMLRKMQSTESVCVHIRRGDYLKVVHQTGVVGIDYLQAGIAYLTRHFANLHFYIFSNDMSWCMDHLKIGFPHTFITSDNAGRNDREHFVLMTSARHFVIANSTYSWWAAWLSNNPQKTVIAPRQWALDPKMNTPDIFPSGWIQMDPSGQIASLG